MPSGGGVPSQSTGAKLLRTQVRTQSSIRDGATCRWPWQHTRRERKISRGANAVNELGAALAFSAMDHQKLALFDPSLCNCLAVISNHFLQLIHLTLNRPQARKNCTEERKNIRRTEQNAIKQRQSRNDDLLPRSLRVGFQPQKLDIAHFVHGPDVGCELCHGVLLLV